MPRKRTLKPNGLAEECRSLATRLSDGTSLDAEALKLRDVRNPLDPEADPGVTAADVAEGERLTQVETDVQELYRLADQLDLTILSLGVEPEHVSALRAYDQARRAWERIQGERYE